LPTSSTFVSQQCFFDDKTGQRTSGVPGAEEIDAAREEAGLEEAEQDAHAGELAKVLDKAHANHDAAPEQGDGGQMDAGAQLADHNGGGWLEDDVGDEEDEVGNVVVQSLETELDVHAGDSGGAHVGAVHQTDAVHGAANQNQTAVGPADDCLLLGEGEAVVDIVIGLGEGGIVDVAGLVLLFRLVVCHGDGQWREDEEEREREWERRAGCLCGGEGRGGSRGRYSRMQDVLGSEDGQQFCRPCEMSLTALARPPPSA
jgi:hypothetical protein